jgi:hypothetical protein
MPQTDKFGIGLPNIETPDWVITGITCPRANILSYMPGNNNDPAFPVATVTLFEKDIDPV